MIMKNIDSVYVLISTARLVLHDEATQYICVFCVFSCHAVFSLCVVKRVQQIELTWIKLTVY